VFLGHYGLAFALKRAEPKISLGTLFLAAQLVDLAWGATILIGWEVVAITPGWTAASPLRFLSYPITHSFVAAVLWAAAASAVWFTLPTRDTSHHARAALVVALAVASHWVLDAIVHVKDLPLAGDTSSKIGLGLWNNLPATLAVEFTLLIVGVVLYLGSGTRRHPVRRVWTLFFAAALGAVYLVATLGPPPPSVRAIGFGAIAGIAVIAGLAGWLDSSR
jgi:hypothetical protein